MDLVPREADWLDGLTRLQEFVDTRGHAQVPRILKPKMDLGLDNGKRKT